MPQILLCRCPAVPVSPPARTRLVFGFLVFLPFPSHTAPPHNLPRIELHMYIIALQVPPPTSLRKCTARISTSEQTPYRIGLRRRTPISICAAPYDSESLQVPRRVAGQYITSNHAPPPPPSPQSQDRQSLENALTRESLPITPHNERIATSSAQSTAPRCVGRIRSRFCATSGPASDVGPHCDVGRTAPTRRSYDYDIMDGPGLGLSVPGTLVRATSDAPPPPVCELSDPGPRSGPFWSSFAASRPPVQYHHNPPLGESSVPILRRATSLADPRTRARFSSFTVHSSCASPTSAMHKSIIELRIIVFRPRRHPDRRAPPPLSMPRPSASSTVLREYTITIASTTSTDMEWNASGRRLWAVPLLARRCPRNPRLRSCSAAAVVYHSSLRSTSAFRVRLVPFYVLFEGYCYQCLRQNQNIIVNAERCALRMDLHGRAPAPYLDVDARGRLGGLVGPVLGYLLEESLLPAVEVQLLTRL
ncbi:hypothetical protein B0H10DRAFT_2428018 [Mycena sp. CBHHK59/15]|nr:hypothetical protein B0H10DRAFT_2428018 [Mycena sp. CBHHK59/15]